MNGGAFSRFLPLVIALALLSGCKTGPPPVAESLPAPSNASVSRSGAPKLDAAVRPASAIEPIEQPGNAPAAPHEPRPVEAIPAPPHPLPLSLFAAVEMGLAQNPDLIALRYAEGVSEGALGVAETYPFNPWIQIQATPSQSSLVSNTGPTNHYVLLMQQLQLGHQRRHRTAAAVAALNSVRWNYVQAQLINMAATQRLYFTALYQLGLTELTHANAELNNQLLAISQRQFAAGTITGADVAILKLDNAAARRQARLADATYQKAVLDLKRHVGLDAAAPLVLTGRLADWRWQEISGHSALWSRFALIEIPVNADQAWLARTLVSGRPDVSAACADVETARANFDLARANRIPDLQIGPYYQRSNDPTTFWGLRAQMDVPVLNTGAPLVRQRLAELTQRQVIWEQLFNRATLEAQAALDRYDRALAIVSDRESPVGDELPLELRKLEDQFRAGEVDLVRVVTARASYFAARRAVLDTLNELAQASADLVAASGLPPEALFAPSR